MVPVEVTMTDTPRIARRAALAAVSALTAFGLVRSGTAQPRAAAQPIVQPPLPGREAFMARALAMRERAEREGDQAFGAIVVRNGVIVGEAPSRVITNRDPTAHGEIEAIRDAAHRLGTNDLSGCDLYSSFRPCPMCETAAVWARIARIYHGAAITEHGPPRYPSC
jgi:tRNA(Arg) A34 adenosine deaminase TadA